MIGEDHRFSSLFSCCFRCYDSGSDAEKPRLLRRSSTWFRNRAQELPELKEKCRTFFSKINGRYGVCRPRRSHAEFQYDPLSYALNFDDESPREEDESRIHDFSSRFALAASAPAVRHGSNEVSVVSPSVSREITCN